MILAVFAVCAALATQGAPPPAVALTEQEELAAWARTRDERLAWWREARFGMFVHWGLYSGAGGTWDGKVYAQHYAEWIQNWARVPSATYASALKPLFLPAAGCTDAWAELAVEAGMRYAVLTAKHHEGFTLFNSKQPYSLANAVTGGTNISPEGRDLALEFATAMRARGLRAGFYYSLLDWQHPDAYAMSLPVARKDTPAPDPARYVDYLRAHVRELLGNYGPLSTLWFDYSDSERQGAAWGAAGILHEMRTSQPAILVNNRLFDGLENKRGDYGTPEKYVPPTGLPGMDWEVNHTLNESYGFSSHDTQWKDTTSVVRLLCDIVSKGGNLLLNVGPDAAGRVPEEAARTLRGVGAWMKRNGAAIHGTSASPFARLSWGRATRKRELLYLLVFDWPADGVLRVPLGNEVTSAGLLGSPAVVTVLTGAREGALELRVPAAPLDPACSVIALRIVGEPDVKPFAVRADSAGAFRLAPHDAMLSGPSLRVEQVGHTGDVQYNLGWWSDASAFAAWPLVLERAGSYRIEAEIACEDASAGSRMAVECGSAHAEFSVPATGGWQQYRRLDLGRLELRAGRAELTLRARSKPGEAVLNLRALHLLPADD